MRRGQVVIIVLIIVGGILAPLLDLVVNAVAGEQTWGPLEPIHQHLLQSGIAFAAGLIFIGIVTERINRKQQISLEDTSTLEKVCELFAGSVDKVWTAEAKRRWLTDPDAILVEWEPCDPSLVPSWDQITRLARRPKSPCPSATTWAENPSGLAGKGKDIASILDRIPTGRLVILGEIGAGKTTLLITLLQELLEARKHQESKAVPILLSLASWNPADEGQPLRDWITKQLIKTNSALNNPAPNNHNISQAKALLDSGLIVPLLDGFDEIPDSVRGFAIAQINAAMRRGERWVFASRTREFEEAVNPQYEETVAPPPNLGVQLAGAAGIKLCPLNVDHVCTYLRESAGSPAAQARWKDVFRTISNDNSHPIAQAFKIPLLVVLARAIYNPRPREELHRSIGHPKQLLKAKICESEITVQHHLYDSLIPAAYRPDSTDTEAKWRRLRRLMPHKAWKPQEVDKWLTFIARDIQKRQKEKAPDFDWWTLPTFEKVPHVLSGLTVGLLAGATGFIGYPFPVDFGVGLLATLSIGLIARRWLEKRKRATRPGLLQGVIGGMLGGLIGAVVALGLFGSGPNHIFAGAFLAGALAFGLAAGALRSFQAGFIGTMCGILISATSRHSDIVGQVGALHGPAAQVVNGLGVGLAAGLAVHEGLRLRDLPARGLRWSPVGFFTGSATGLFMGFVVGIQVGLTSGVIVGLLSFIAGGYGGGFSKATPASLTKASTPRVLLKRDRAAFRATFLGFGLAAGIVTGLSFGLSPALERGLPNEPYGLGVGALVGITNFLAIGLTLAFAQASWGSFTLSRLWLALFHCLPWRLMSFLEDAHSPKRGLLYQNGGSYQFRHAEFQERLISNEHKRPEDLNQG